MFSKYETKDINKVAFDDFTDKQNCVPLAVLLTFQTGLRIGEIVALKWEDVDLTDDALYILRMLEKYYKSEHLESEWLFVNPKGRIHNRAMDLRIRKYCKLTGIREKSLHKVRSTYISMLRASGMSFEKSSNCIECSKVFKTLNTF